MLLGTVSAHQIKSSNGVPIVPFSSSTYSRFKHGCLRSSDVMGRELAEAFIKYDRTYNIIEYDTPVVVAASAYSTIPVASVQLKDAFVKYFNRYLQEFGMRDVEEIKIRRDGSHPQDYGKLTAEERKALISTDVFTIDEDLDSCVTLFIDDIRVTGTHEQILQRSINDKRDFKHVFLYYATVESSDIDCRIENELNKADISNLAELAELIDKGSTVINVRVVKTILQSDNHAVEGFLKGRHPEFIEDLKRAALTERYFKVPQYRKNIQTLNQIANEFRTPQATGA